MTGRFNEFVVATRNHSDVIQSLISFALIANMRKKQNYCYRLSVFFARFFVSSFHGIVVSCRCVYVVVCPLIDVIIMIQMTYL